MGMNTDRVTISPPYLLTEGGWMGHLSRRLAKILADRELTERQAAARAGMQFESFRKILRGMTERPRDVTLQRIADGLGVPVEVLARERARDAGEAYAAPMTVQDITTSEALDIAIARVHDLPEGELQAAREQAQRLLRLMQEEAGRSAADAD